MKNILVLIFIISQSFSVILAQDQALSKHVILISIDGFRPDFYLEEKWPAPNLKLLAQEGAYALGVRSVFPSVTYPSHTTIITGAYPAEHGIYYNSPFEPEGETGRWYWESSLIKTETLWDAVQKSGKKSASLIWPVSVGAPIDYNIPEVWTLDKSYGRIQPMRDNETPKGLLQEMELAVLGKMDTITFNGDYLDILVMLTPHSGHVDPSVDFGQKDNFMTILQFFS